MPIFGVGGAESFVRDGSARHDSRGKTLLRIGLQTLNGVHPGLVPIRRSIGSCLACLLLGPVTSLSPGWRFLTLHQELRVGSTPRDVGHRQEAFRLHCNRSLDENCYLSSTSCTDRGRSSNVVDKRARKQVFCQTGLRSTPGSPVSCSTRRGTSWLPHLGSLQA